MIVEFVMYVITNMMCWHIDRDVCLGLNGYGREVLRGKP